MQSTYSFSFTSSSMLLPEMLRVAAYFLDGGTREEADPEAILRKGKRETSNREFRELAKRVERLTAAELELLVEGSLPVQKQMAFLAICKTYRFIRDFMIEVVREKSLVFDYEIRESDYRSFFNRKRDLHPEMDDLSDTSVKKVRQRIFTILEQADILDDAANRQIQPQIISPKVMDVIVEDNPNWLKIFLLSDSDIEATLA